MLRNYFKTAWRSLTRYKVFTLINVAGLSIGMAAALVIYLIVQHDFTFDKFEKDNDRIYRVVSDLNFSGVPYYNAGVPEPVGPTLKTEATGISEVAAFQVYNYDNKVTIPTNNSNQPVVLKKQENITFADENYFKIIDYKWLAGSANRSLKDPHQLVLTQKRAELYFPGLTPEQVIGKQVIYNDTVTTTVSGIVADIKQNTDFVFTDFISLTTIPNSGLKGDFSWGKWGMTNGSSQLFVKLSPGISKQMVDAQLVKINTKYIQKRSGYHSAFVLQPLSDLHFNELYSNFDHQTANKTTLYGLLVIAVFLLLLGCINFINLSTAQASQRAKEIGIRKTLGSSVKQLMAQFLSETFLITILATIVSISVAPVILKLFADFVPKGLKFDLFHQPHLMVFLVLLVISVSLLSGYYPAWVLSKYNPVRVLKDQVYTNSALTRKAWIRKSLTVFQFLIAQVFIMGTFIVAKQIHYTLNKDLGFKKEAIISFSTPWFHNSVDKRPVLMNQLRAIPGIQMLSMASSSPATGGTSSGQVNYKDGKKEIQTNVQFKMGDTSYLKLYQIRLLAGRNVQQSDTVKEAIINETYAHILGFKNANDAVGKNLEWSKIPLPIVGVIADFHQESLREPIKPLMFTGATNDSYDIHVALKPQLADGNTWKTTIAQIETAYKKVYPNLDFEYDFYDKKIAGFYEKEQHTASLLKWATGVAIFISCLGLLGLVIYTTNQRVKEIGIRKVLGASVAHIVSILSKDLVRLVLIAFAIALPIAWYSMSKWLQSYAYKTTMSWWIFILSGALMLFIALITLSFQTIRAALANPVKSLKSE